MRLMVRVMEKVSPTERAKASVRAVHLAVLGIGGIESTKACLPLNGNGGLVCACAREHLI